MAVVARNRRTQEDILNSIGIRKPSGNRMVDTTPGYVTPKNPTPSASDIQGMPKNPISFSGPPAAVTNGVVGVKPASAQVETVGKAPGSDNTINGGGTASQVSARYNPFDERFNRRQFTTSGDTDEYYDLMRETEENRPDPFESRYEGAIQNILNGILNGNQERFDINKDANYQSLYDLYAQQYQANANRGMRDTMGAMQAATGGYGSTAATAAAGQAYDRAMEGLNDRNMELMQLAYQMYGDAQNDRYRQLGAVTGLDDTDYARYRDTVGDWQTDRNYYAGQYQNFFGNDMNRYQFDVGMDWNEYQDRANRAWQEFEYGDQRDYQRERDKLADYDDAFNMAYKLAAAGHGIPAAYASRLEPETIQMLQGIAAEAQAAKAAKGSGGGGGGRRPAANKSVEVLTGQPYASGIGYTANRNMVIDAIKKQGDNQGKYNVIEDAVADGMITQEQGLDLLRAAKVDLLKTTSAPDYIRRHYVDAGTKVKKKK